MICRLWRGWTTTANADPYQRLLREEIFECIADRNLSGFHGIDLLRRDEGQHVEFVTVMWFESLEAAKEFAGADFELAVVPAEAQRLLERFDARSAHYTVEERRPSHAS
ncbi:MAG: hypothetical protein WD825_05140 [Gemmatimonadaceae bacterium]